MKDATSFPILLESFFTKRLIAQRRASPHTIGSYRDTFRLLLQFAEKRLAKAPSRLTLEDLQAPFLGVFLDDLESTRANGARSRNLRLTAIRSFFRYIALEAQYAGLIQRVLAIPNKRQPRPLVGLLTRPEIDALLAAPDRDTWLGRRDHALLLTVIQTGLRLSEITSIRRQDVSLGKGAHIRCEGKGRKERCTPLAKSTVTVLTAWFREQGEDDGTRILFPTVQGGRLSADAVQHLVRKYVAVAQKTCSSLADKRVSPHVLRHTTAMELPQSGVDRTLIALWLGRESVETTQIYLHANLAIKGEILAKTTPINAKAGRYPPDDDLLAFLKGL